MSIDIQKELKLIHDRITAQNTTMEAMWNRMRPVTQFYDWVKETHPDLLNQYVSIRELEELGKSKPQPEMRAFSSAPVKASGQAVKYEVGNGTL
jgi:hypothetical protein